MRKFLLPPSPQNKKWKDWKIFLDLISLWHLDVKDEKDKENVLKTLQINKSITFN